MSSFLHSLHFFLPFLTPSLPPSSAKIPKWLRLHDAACEIKPLLNIPGPIPSQSGILNAFLNVFELNQMIVL